jgi:hypothetical protein
VMMRCEFGMMASRSVMLPVLRLTPTDRRYDQLGLALSSPRCSCWSFPARYTSRVDQGLDRWTVGADPLHSQYRLEGTDVLSELTSLCLSPA